MSHSDNQILQVVGVDDADEEVGGDSYEEKQRGFVCTRSFKRAKQVVLSKLRQKPKPPHQSNLVSSSANAALSGTTTTTSTKGCCFCFKKPLTLDSPVESLCSDPNDPNFSYDMLKSLIENNDFYSKESNPHLHFP